MFITLQLTLYLIVGGSELRQLASKRKQVAPPQIATKAHCTELGHALLLEALLFPGFNSCPVELFPGLVSGLALFPGFFGSELLGLKLGFLGYELVGFRSPELTSNLELALAPPLLLQVLDLLLNSL
ncbi:hypothetical protein VE02_10319 [Pseudogymnoascus sp. 03VT05]|nr:hypothetical protein VE02_10319 [Pseudogymnoascus sp. 03VT05]